MYITADLDGHLSAKKTLEFLNLKPSKRRMILAQMTRVIRSRSRGRIRQQRDLRGEKFTPRKGKSKKKLLAKMGRQLVTKSSPDKATVGYKSAILSKIARAHQDGLNEVMTAAKARRKYGSPNYDDSATRQQAKRLRDLGYKIRRKKGKGWKRPTLKWIVQNLTLGQAGLIIKTLANDDGKDSWVIPLPSRSYLGVTDSDYKELEQIILKNTIKKQR